MKILHVLVAIFRLSPRVVCAQSAGRGRVDYHDYPDTTHGQPLHFFTHTCARCGKQFTI